MNIISKNQRGESAAQKIKDVHLRVDVNSTLVENRSDLISTVWKTPYPAMPTWANTLPRHFRRGPASHKPFDFLSSIIYPFYMFYTAKTFSVHRRVRNHYSKRILNLILNRKKFLRRENDPLGRQKPRQNRRATPSPPISYLSAVAR